MNQITDYFQQPLTVGDRIVYPVGLGSSGVGLAEAKIEMIEELVPIDPHDLECREGTKYSERHLAFPARTRLELMLKYDQQRRRYVYDPTKLFKLRVIGWDTWSDKWNDKPTWIKNVDRVILAPASVQG